MVGTTVTTKGTTATVRTLGAQGPRGPVWREGSGPPDDSLGANGDFYHDRDSGDVYQKLSDTYGTPYGNIKGPKGDKGAEVLVGTDSDRVPTNADIDGRGFAAQVDSVSALRSTSFPASLDRIWLSGDSGAGTPGAGPLYRDSSDTTTADDGKNVFVDADGVRWKRPVYSHVRYRPLNDGLVSQIDPANIDPNGDNESYNLSIQAGTPGAGQTRKDIVMHLGYNTKDNGRVNTDEHSLALHWESYYLSDFAKTEWYVQHYDKNGTGVRPIGGAWPVDATAPGAQYVTTLQNDVINFTDPSGKQRVKVDIEDDLAAIDLTEKNGSPVRFRQGLNDSEWLYQRKAGGGYESLFKLNGNDNLEFMPGSSRTGVRGFKISESQDNGGFIGLVIEDGAGIFELYGDATTIRLNDSSSTDRLQIRLTGGSRDIAGIGGTGSSGLTRVQLGPHAISGDPEVDMQVGKIGFFGAAPVSKPSASDLSSLLSALDSLGLVTDNS